MKINIHTDAIYERLQNETLTIQDAFFLEAIKQMREGDAWKGEKSISLPKAQVYYRGSSSPLPFPLESARVIADRQGTIFSASAIINYSRIPGNLSHELEKKLGDLWVACNEQGLGYILSAQKEIAVAILHQGFSYYIGLGECGAAPRKFASKEYFETDMETLRSATETFINAFLDRSKAERRCQKNPDITVCLR